jgi:hypothetical protein
MKNIRSFILLLLLVWISASFNLGVAVVGPLSKSAFACIAQTQHLYEPGPFVIVRIYKVSGTPGVDPNAVQTLINAGTVALKYKIHAYMELCRNNDPISQVNDLFSGVPTSLYGTLWVKVEPNNTPGCSWAGYNPTDNCNFLIETFRALKGTLTTFLSVGVFSTARIWESFFGNTCTSIPSFGALLWYAIYDKTGNVKDVASFGDFIPFGGWTLGYLKQVQGNQTITLCSHANWHAFVDIVEA